MPIIDNLTDKTQPDNNTSFSTLDLNDGYSQINLELETIATLILLLANVQAHIVSLLDFMVSRKCQQHFKK